MMEKLRTTDLGRCAAAFLFMAVAAIWLATADFPLIDRLQFVSTIPERAVSSGHELVQTFTATADNISRVDLVLVKSQQGPAGELDLRIVEAGDSSTDDTSVVEAPVDDAPQADAPVQVEVAPVSATTLAETTLDTGTFDYTAIRRFEFEPAPLKPGETFAFSLNSDDPEENAVHPGSNPNDEYTGGRLYIDGKPEKGDLYFAIFHSAGAGGLIEKMEPWRPFPLNSPVLIVALFLAGAGAFGWLLWAVAGNQGDPEKSG